MVSGAGSIIYGHTHTTLLQDTIIIAQYYIIYLPVVLELHLIIYHLYNKKKRLFPYMINWEHWILSLRGERDDRWRKNNVTLNDAAIDKFINRWKKSTCGLWLF